MTEALALLNAMVNIVICHFRTFRRASKKFSKRTPRAVTAIKMSFSQFLRPRLLRIRYVFPNIRRPKKPFLTIVATSKRIAAMAGLNEQCIAYALLIEQKNLSQLEQQPSTIAARPKQNTVKPIKPPVGRPPSKIISNNSMNKLPRNLTPPSPLSPRQSPPTYPPIINPNSPPYDPTEPAFGGREAYLSPSPQPQPQGRRQSVRLPPLRAIAPPPPLPPHSLRSPSISTQRTRSPLSQRPGHPYSHATISIPPLTPNVEK